MSGKELNLNLPKFACLVSCFLVRLFGTSIILVENCHNFCILVFNFFTAKCNQFRCCSRWENVERGQY